MVKRSMEHTWEGYVSHAWGMDEAMPTRGSGNNRWGSMGMSIIDSLDTLFLMGMRDEFDKGVEWVRNSLDWHDSKHGQISVFETTIRALGGLLSAYDLSKDEILLTRARELGDGLMPVFGTKTGIAQARTTLYRGGGSGMATTLAEAGTLQLEFTFLSKLTGDNRYHEAAYKFHQFLYEKHKHDTANERGGMFPISVNVGSGGLSGIVSWGASGDSAYEYFLKCYLFGNMKDKSLVEMYNRSILGMKERLVKSLGSGMKYLPDSSRGNKMEVRILRKSRKITLIAGWSALSLFRCFVVSLFRCFMSFHIFSFHFISSRLDVLSLIITPPQTPLSFTSARILY